MELSQLLSIAESQAIDQAPISIQAKFLTRITIHAWRVWLQVGQTLNQPIEQLSPQQMVEWLARDAQLSRQGQTSFLAWPKDDHHSEAEQDLSSDQNFVVRLIVSAWDNLGNIAAAYHCAIADLTTDQILTWVASKQQPGQQEIFLGEGDRKTS